ncbi:MAG: HEPN domain-containing protein [Candidatus Hydrogenedentes bacterium]|nr:HEPN domain-containing protein [Candidatus Hydrogenedentota bacterium]
MPPKCIHGTPEEWLERATGKLLLARQPLPQGAFWEDLCFSAHQAVELAIKAVYMRHGWRFPFIHDLAELLDGLVRQGLAVPEEIRAADQLTVFATDVRYPGTGGITSEAQYHSILAIAEEVVKWAAAHVANTEKL